MDVVVNLPVKARYEPPQHVGNRLGFLGEAQQVADPFCRLGPTFQRVQGVHIGVEQGVLGDACTVDEVLAWAGAAVGVGSNVLSQYHPLLGRPQHEVFDLAL